MLLKRGILQKYIDFYSLLWQKKINFEYILLWYVLI